MLGGQCTGLEGQTDCILPGLIKPGVSLMVHGINV